MLTRSLPLSATAAALRCGQLDLREHIDRVCDRIDRLEDQVRALVPETGRRQRLLAEAARIEARWPRSEERPPLYGVLVGIKDIFQVDGFPTRAGSKLPAELHAGPEAGCVAALRGAGALVLGKTETTEFAYFEPGPTRNPHHPGHTPGGSSSGSAAAVAAGYCPLAVGTQTVGSVIRPAAFCGLVGYKPSYGRIDRSGLIFFSASVDHVGLFVQDVAGLRLAGSAVCRDWRDEPGSGDCVLGIPEGPYLEQAGAEALAAFGEQVGCLQAAGQPVRRVRALGDIADLNQLHGLLNAAEMAQVHATWFREYQALYRPRTAALIRKGLAVDPEVVARGRARREELRAELTRCMREHGIDVWLAPAATGPAPEGLSSTGDPVMNLPWTHAGLPAVTLPAGRAANGLPLGLQCVAGFGRDEALIAWAETGAGHLPGVAPADAPTG